MVPGAGPPRAGPRGSGREGPAGGGRGVGRHASVRGAVVCVGRCFAREGVGSFNTDQLSRVSARRWGTPTRAGDEQPSSKIP